MLFGVFFFFFGILRLGMGVILLIKRIVVVIVIIIVCFGLYVGGSSYLSLQSSTSSLFMKNLVGLSLGETQKYAEEVGIQLEIKYQYHYDIEKDKVIAQGILVDSQIEEGDVCEIVVSLGEIPVEIYDKYHVNELGNVPIMMYHGIVDMKSEDTDYIGGNVDKDGYNRTVEAFRGDLEFYYQQGYRMISLDDYIDGVVDVALGKSPIILTFDDGNENNFKVLGEENGELLIDPNCAVGVLEEFKQKYPDYGVTATFFVNQGLFGQDEYNERILKWLVENGYDIGNHTLSHSDFTKIGLEETYHEVGGIYQLLDTIIPSSYVSIVALPFGSPYHETHENFRGILNGNNQGYQYQTKATLRVGWEAERSCFDKEFHSVFLKRIRAYDNNGRDFDIEYNFKLLESTRYISDGDKDTVVVLESDLEQVLENGKRVRTY